MRLRGKPARYVYEARVTRRTGVAMVEAITVWVGHDKLFSIIGLAIANSWIKQRHANRRFITPLSGRL
jgi:hypothetical protein